MNLTLDQKKKTLKGLMDAHELFRDQQYWVKGTTHRRVNSARLNSIGLMNHAVIDQYCIIGANGSAANSNRQLYDAMNFYVGREILKKHPKYADSPHFAGVIPGFNDNEETTHEDVMEVYAAATETLAEEIANEMPKDTTPEKVKELVHA